MSPEQIQSLLNVNNKSKNQVQCVSFGICEARQMLGEIKIAGSYKTAKNIYLMWNLSEYLMGNTNIP